MTNWSIQEVARLAGTTSRTLRHYGELGLVPPSSIGANGMRHYDEAAVRRLQRVLLLREQGLALGAISAVLEGTTDEVVALREHLAALHRERDLLDRRIASMTTTINHTERKDPIMAEQMLDGFAHERYEAEVTERWGGDAWRRSDEWWRGLGDDGRADFRVELEELNAAWIAAVEGGIAADSDEALALARRHVIWLGSVPGAPRGEAGVDWAYVLGLGDLYVADERFAANYGGLDGATFVRDALRSLAAADGHELGD